MTLNLGHLDGTNGFRLDGVAEFDETGASVAGAEDVNGDGIDDLIVGARSADADGENSAGASYVVFGREGGFVPSLDLALLDGTNGFRLDGVAEADYSGTSVSSAGDLNGDGIGDLIVGAPESGDAGASYVVFGRADGFDPSLDLGSLDGTNGFRLDGVAGGDDSGRDVAGAGDVNGDGIDDLIIGDPRADGEAGQSEAGQSYVVFGSVAGFDPSLDLAALDGTNGFRLHGINQRDFAGYSVDGAGDVNGDGVDDIIVGARYADADGVYDAGATYLVFGTTTGFAPDLDALDGTNGFRVAGVVAEDENGTSVAGAGDVNGDGIDDLIVGAPRATSDDSYFAGVSYVVFGTDTGFAPSVDLAALDGTNGFRLDGVAFGDHSGWSVAGAGDVNGDGFDDLLVGTRGIDTRAVYLVFGAGDGFAASLDLATFDGTNGIRFEGDAYSGFGGPVAGAGDINDDGIDDLLFGAPGAGESYVVFGSTGLGGANDAPVATDDTLRAEALDVVDLAVDHGAGADRDPDLDTLTIVAIDGVAVVPGDSVTLASGLRVTFVGGTEVRFDAPGVALGTVISTAFSYEISDGRGGSDSATVTVDLTTNALALADLEGALDLRHLDGTNGFRLSGIDDRDYSGSSVAGAGDINGDGIDDAIVGAPDAGESYVVFGTRAGFSGTFDLASLDGNNGFRLAGAGAPVAGAGDFNGDGLDDLIIGAPDAGSLNSGASYIVFGSSDGFAASLDLASLDGTNGFQIAGTDEQDGTGSSVAGAGDVNGDGIDDLIVGAPRADPDRKGYAGETYVVFGTSAGFPASLDAAALDGSNGFRLDGVDAADSSGSAVAGAGDVNGDGIDDLIVGARSAGPDGSSYAGASYVVFGTTTGFDARIDLAALDGTNGFRLTGAGAYDQSGVSVAGGGDVNSDGIDDLIVGASEVDGDGAENAGASYVVFGTRTGFAASLDLADLDGGSGFRIVGISEGNDSGASVAGAGDINGDGLDDLLVGAPGADANGRYHAGETYVIFGSKTGFAPVVDGTAGFRLLGIDTYDRSGSSVAAAGTINGDGIDDLMVGAPRAGEDDEGESYVIFGSTRLGGSNDAPVAADDTLIVNPFEVIDLAADNGAGADKDPDFDRLTIVSIRGAAVTAGDRITLPSGLELTFLGGTELSVEDPGGLRPGDAIPDSFDYVISDGRGGSDAATVAIEFRQDTLYLSALDGSDGFRIDGVAAGDYTGYSVAGTGDVNGDGFADLVVGAPGAGASYVIFGSNDGFPATFDPATLDGSNGFRLDGSGSAVAAAGDVNGDGVGDVFVDGAVVFGTDAGFPESVDLAALDGTDGFRLVADPSDYSTSIAGAGDVNGDGLDDLMVGVLSTDGGRSYVVFGASDGFDPTLDLTTLDGTDGFRLSGIGSYEALDLVAAGAGDLNGDGFDDMVIGVPADYASGNAYVVFGWDAGFADVDVSRLDGTNGFHATGNGFVGRSVAGAGDVNGDGIDDLIIGAPDWYGDAGSYVVFGSLDDFSANFDLEALDGSNGFRIDGTEDDSGFMVAGAGDFNGDGIDDLIVGSRTPNETYVVFGTEQGFAPIIELAELDGTDGFRLAGELRSVAGAGDVNGDGFDDLIVGDSDGDITAEDAGASYVILGFDPGAPAEAAGGAAVPARGAAIDGDNDFEFRASREGAERLYPLTLAGFERWSKAVDPGPMDPNRRHEGAEFASDADRDEIDHDALAGMLDLI